MLNIFSTLLISVLFIGSLLANDHHDHYDHIKKEMDKDEIIPSILPEAPRYHLHATYPNETIVHLGNELTPEQTKDDPQVSWHADAGKFYTLVMIDPDAPSRENNSVADVKHWLVGNIKGGDVSTGDIIAEYFGPGPPKGTGFHRYIFVVYEQKGRLDFDEPRSEKWSRAYRLKWSLTKFVEKYDLGKPLAGDYFKAQWDPYVDERNKKVTNN